MPSTDNCVAGDVRDSVHVHWQDLVAKGRMFLERRVGSQLLGRGFPWGAPTEECDRLPLYMLDQREDSLPVY
jgi:hypothetical protein